MDFAMSAKGQDYHDRLTAFMLEHVFPAEASYDAYRHEKGPNDHTVPPVVEDIKKQVKDGTLTIRKMTAEERKKNPPKPVEPRKKRR